MEPYAMKSDFIDNRYDHGNTASMTTDNKNIVGQALAELIETGSVDALEPLLSDDFVHHRPDSTSSTKSEWLAAVHAALRVCQTSGVTAVVGVTDGPQRGGRRR
ncbi:hypothetical protein [Streptomyces sp. ME18-1-4]|uniref:hypothetical protein n=1 Tax=Streptomyces sp. ME18-1-4 TaxID=3028685 RepID=UPI0029B31B98|nr:hypothetical protein [Streptomyces sp. ME18-1-4]MDX3246149.1 hypothetical protein [Streptomyces sp. ME18-1-4]